MAVPSRREAGPAGASPSGAAPAGTVVFTGDTLEGALAAARAAYGPRVPVVRAQRVRQGVRGLLGHVRYDVHVVPTSALAGARPPRPTIPTTAAAPRPAAPAHGVADALADLVAAAEARESAAPRAGGAGEGAPAAAWSWTGDAEVGALLEEVAAFGTARGRGPDVVPPRPAAPGPSGETAGRHPAPSVATHRTAARTGSRRPDGRRGDLDVLAGLLAGEPVRGDVVPGRADLDLPPPSPSRDLLLDALGAPAPTPRPSAPTGPAVAPGWDRGELRALGVPSAVLRRLPVEDPPDDAAWRRALVEAVAAVVPPPAEPDADHPVVVSGSGLPGAVAVMRAAVEDGAVPGTIAFRGRRRPASPAALVEVLAACVRS